MADEEHLKILKKGVNHWNLWRYDNRDVIPILIQADLSGAALSRAKLREANLSGADLSRAKLSNSLLWFTIFVDVDLSEVEGLDKVDHFGPSSIGIDTIYK